MPAAALYAPGLTDTQGATLLRYDTQTTAAKELRRLYLAPEVAPVKISTRFGWYWALWATPLGDPGEASMLTTAERGWLQVCAVPCVRHETTGTCPGHPYTGKAALDYTLALCGHRTRVARIFTQRRENRTDGTFDWLPAGTHYRANCLCGWKGRITDWHRAARLDGDDHSGAPSGNRHDRIGGIPR
ncbi:hypothetical protein AB0B66_10600 [Catellatospora sp. NPDC049111]|uniref:hypothetical protein n=1 Tax=Catellatospora sp. NPDC049111 TaxID=3155271 RepID=UPI0033E1542A